MTWSGDLMKASDTWKGTRVLVTGAGGFIGSHLVERLAGEGARVRAFVRYTSRSDLGLLKFVGKDALSSVEIVRGDLRDPAAILSAMRECEYVFHLGALIAIPYSYVHPREVVDTNIIGTLNILEAARMEKPHRVIHTSTSEVYGTAQTTRIKESHPVQGQSPYSASKIGADKLAESYYRAFDVPVVTVRPFNTYGPRQSARAVIPTIITQALSLGRVTIGAVTPTRDFTYVSDTVAGFLAAAAAPAEKVLGREINLGNDEEISVGELAKSIIDIVGRELEVVSEEERMRPTKSEVNRLHADNRLAKELLNWSPSVPLVEGLRKTVDWIRGNLEMYRVGTYET
jgi:NAD dependent epimerase/dehydratase